MTIILSMYIISVILCLVTCLTWFRYFDDKNPWDRYTTIGEIVVSLVTSIIPGLNILVTISIWFTMVILYGAYILQKLNKRI